eukprot:CAMPEP_0168560620 /NCGR_PEP_ID=MMETSP0413-20121227/11158_1 /TAXON_ID=136452 /ORGANISM="Filamoeba nolandi, Strain NC-AS-23-1" /LENGTH=332 /DNA_ID=CAMNT_0008591935 /DNA_START=223 /DNA_END=1218 /DNA_ORIENTATION=-
MSSVDIHNSAVGMDSHRGILFIFLRQWFYKDEISNIDTYMSDLSNCNTILDTTRRGDGNAKHIGWWTTRGKGFDQAIPTTNSTPSVAKLLYSSVPLVQATSPVVKYLFPAAAMLYETVPSHFRPFDLWSLMIANFISPQTAHTDYEDVASGICCLIPLGEFAGGQLYFEQLKTTIHCQPGDCILFRSDVLKHKVLPFDGLRMSVVFVTHARFIKHVAKSGKLLPSPPTTLVDHFKTVISTEALNARMNYCMEARSRINQRTKARRNKLRPNQPNVLSPEEPVELEPEPVTSSAVFPVTNRRKSVASWGRPRTVRNVSAAARANAALRLKKDC